MLRHRSTPGGPVGAAHSRLVRFGALGALVLVGALLLLGTLDTGAVGASTSARNHGDHTSYALQHEAAVVANVSNRARSQRLVFAGAFLALSCLAATVVVRAASRRRLFCRARSEQFHVRLRGPPVLRIAY